MFNNTLSKMILVDGLGLIGTLILAGAHFARVCVRRRKTFNPEDGNLTLCVKRLRFGPIT